MKALLTRKLQRNIFNFSPGPPPPGSNSETILLGNPNGLSRRLNQEGYGSRAAEVKVKGDFRVHSKRLKKLQH